MNIAHVALAIHARATEVACLPAVFTTQPEAANPLTIAATRLSLRLGVPLGRARLLAQLAGLGGGDHE